MELKNFSVYKTVVDDGCMLTGYLVFGKVIIMGEWADGFKGMKAYVLNYTVDKEESKIKRFNTWLELEDFVTNLSHINV